MRSPPCAPYCSGDILAPLLPGRGVWQQPGRGKSPPSHAHSHLTLPSGVQVDAVVLESPYTNIREAGANIPLTKVSLGALPGGVTQQ